MIKMLTLAALTFGISQSAFAKLVCHHEDQTLEIEFFQAPPSANVDVKFQPQKIATATLTTSSGQQVLKGSNGKFIEDLYHLENENGEYATLEIKEDVITDYGGRCGRCSPIINIKTYAILTLPQAEPVDFVCE